MSKKCSSCGFQNNPDNAHYCGKCGKSLELFGARYELYNSRYNTVVSNSQLQKYREYERKANASLGSRLASWWDAVVKWLKDDGFGWMALGGALLVFLYAAFTAIRSCSDSHKQIARIKVDGKYGLGYDADNLLVPAVYDSIAPYTYGNQWKLIDRTTGKVGMAYVTDSVQHVVPMEYASAGLWSAGNAILRRPDDTCDFAWQGVVTNSEPYRRIEPAGSSSVAMFIVTRSDGKKMFIGVDGKLISDKAFNNVVVDNDSTLRAISYENREYTTQLYDRHGNLLTDKIFDGVHKFSDGVAWATIDKNDDRNKVRYLIDRRGNVLFRQTGAGRTVDFSEGIGWYAPSYSSQTFHAVDKKGKELFTLEAESVKPFTMGLAPVYKGTGYYNRKLGFVDHQGRTVIPFKYKAKYDNVHFSSDSLVEVSLDGVEGRLHRSGAFRPL